MARKNMTQVGGMTSISVDVPRAHFSGWILHFASLLWVTCLFVPLPVGVDGSHDARRLYDDLLRKSNYNRLLRPVRNSTDKLTVRLGLKLSQLVDVDEKNEILATNMWLLHVWQDFSLQWDPREYGGVDTLHVPSAMIWLPDIVLYNNADGDYTVTLMTKATVDFSGMIHWEPPVIFKSHCDINVMYFPFDEQLCRLKLGSWSYDGFQVDLRHKDRDKYGTEELVTIDKAIDLTYFYDSVEWDVMDVAAKKNIIHYPCCPEPFPDVTFNITIRRKTLYYSYTLIIPCVSINMLTILAFYLPCECCEKVSICITILLSLSLFQLLLMELVPNSSTSVSMMGRYLLFTSSLVSISVFLSVVIINLNHRTREATRMPRMARRVFLEILPKLLLMRKPKDEEDGQGQQDDISVAFVTTHSDLSNYGNPYKKKFEPISASMENLCNTNSSFLGIDVAGFEAAAAAAAATAAAADWCEACALKRLKLYGPNVQKGFDGVAFIAKHMDRGDQRTKIRDEWRYSALVVNRIMLWIYITICSVGALGILLNAPFFRDNRQPLKSGDKSAVNF